jgi:hypothetical protein
MLGLEWACNTSTDRSVEPPPTMTALAGELVSGYRREALLEPASLAMGMGLTDTNGGCVRCLHGYPLGLA